MADEDPNRKGAAVRELATLRQGNREFSANYTDFQRVIRALLQYERKPNKNKTNTAIFDCLSYRGVFLFITSLTGL